MIFLRHDIVNRQTAGLSDIRKRRLRPNPNQHPLPERERLRLYERGGEEWSHVSPVWRCWVLGLWSHVVLCRYVPWGGARFTYCMLTNSGEEDICCSSSTTHFIPSIPHSLSVSSLGGNNSPPQDRLPGFIKLKRPIGGLVGRPFGWPFFLFVPFFGIVRLAPTGRP